jgi:enterochelin esterase-like enzyme
MLAVLPNVRAKTNDSDLSDVYGPESIAAFDNFINDLRDDLMPFIKANYSVSDKREDNAIAGLSMGGREALFIGVSMPETFGYVGAFCPAPGLMSSSAGFPGQLEPEEMTLPVKYKRSTFILINAGNQDNVVGDNPINYSNAFTANGVEHAYYSIDGGHDFNVWKNGLYWFAKCIFN